MDSCKPMANQKSNSVANAHPRLSYYVNVMLHWCPVQDKRNHQTKNDFKPRIT